MSGIPFNKPCVVGGELAALQQAILSNKLSGDGAFTKECNEAIRAYTGTHKALLTTSCTHALEMAAMLLEVQPGDEIIMPSFTFVSTANAFVLRGATIVFVDIDPVTLNIDPARIRMALTERTRAIVAVHYAGVACDMDAILQLARDRAIPVVEDAAQAFGAYHCGVHLGTLGDLGAFSFHDTKNITCGEGGALLVNRADMVERSEIIREKGTNRSRFLRGQIDKYTWVDVGSSYLPSELNAAYLLCQVNAAERVKADRLATWAAYFDGFEALSRAGTLELASLPTYATNNAHMFYVKTKNLEERTRLIQALRNEEISAVSHYIPLHSSSYGMKCGRFEGPDIHTTRESERILRLPLYYGMDAKDVAKVVSAVKGFFR